MNSLYSLRFAVYISYLPAGVKWRARHGTNKVRTKKKEIKQKKRKQRDTWMKINKKLNKELRNMKDMTVRMRE
jgi:hypothetical protein